MGTVRGIAEALHEMLDTIADETNDATGAIARLFFLHRKRVEECPEAQATSDILHTSMRLEEAIAEAVVVAEDTSVALRRGVNMLLKAIADEEAQRTSTREEHNLTDPAVRKQVFNLTGGKCAYCDTQLVESGGEQDQFCVEHVVPASMGGPNHLVNYVPSCRSCNNSKGDRHVLYFIRNSFVLRNRAPAPMSPVTPIAEAAE